MWSVNWALTVYFRESVSTTNPLDTRLLFLTRKLHQHVNDLYKALKFLLFHISSFVYIIDKCIFDLSIRCLFTFQQGFLIGCFSADRFIHLELGIPRFEQIHSLLQEVTKWCGVIMRPQIEVLCHTCSRKPCLTLMKIVLS